MASDLDFDIKGLDEAVRNMRRFNETLQKRGLTSSMRKAMEIVKQAAIRESPVKTGKMQKSIVIRTRTKKGRAAGGLAVAVGFIGGAKQYVNNKPNRREGRVGQEYEHGDNVFYWRFLEFGTKDIQARPFMRPALEHNAEDVATRLQREINVQITKLTKAGNVPSSL